MRALLVEPNYHSKYPNLALMKISTRLKREGYETEYFKGMKHPTLEDTLNGSYDEIYITTLFTYDSEVSINTINYYKKTYPRAKIVVGGILASLNPEYIEEKTGVVPFVGYSKELDMIRPDYDLIKTGTKWDDYSFVFTSRGCVNRCPYCAVPKIEPEPWINPNWKNAVDLNRPNIMISDNNLTSQPLWHFKDVMDFIKRHKLRAVFDNGFDCRLFNEEHLEAIREIKFVRHGLRFAFDNMSQDGHIQKTMEMIKESGISLGNTYVYVLFNFVDTPQEAEYRARTVVNTGAFPYPQRYVPLNKMIRKPNYIGKYWTEKLACAFRFFYLMHGYNRKMTFPEWLQKTDEKKYQGLIKDYERYPLSRIKKPPLQDTSDIVPPIRVL